MTLRLINQRDMAILNRILARVENDENYAILAESGEAEFIQVGFPNVISTRPFNTVPTSGLMDSSIVECGIFNCQSYRIPNAIRLIQYGTIRYSMTGWDDLPDQRQEKLRPLIVGRPAWPETDSLTITEDGEIILIFEPLREN